VGLVQTGGLLADDGGPQENASTGLQALSRLRIQAVMTSNISDKPEKLNLVLLVDRF
jgi:hypothetical protein